MILSAPLEDARHLAQRYSRMRQEAETQVMTFPLYLSVDIFLVVTHRKM